MSRPTCVRIDLAALRHNVRRVRALMPGRSILAMVKANAYGHGIVCIAQALAQEVEALGVACLDEGIRLREAGITTPIVLIEGLFYPDEIEEAAHYQFDLVIHHLPHVSMLEKVTVDRPFRVWLKINTGMHRLGVEPALVKTIYQRLLQINAVQKPIGLMTHLAQADELKEPATLMQIDLFSKVTQGMLGPRSVANSAGILGWPHIPGDWVRPGLMLYGASPFPGKEGASDDLKPVMTLTSQIIAINSVESGGRVGYGGLWTASSAGKVGIVAVGYGDGYPQQAQNGTPVLVNGRRCGLAGRVSMDMLAVDLSDQPEVAVGDPVILWGKGLPVEHIARFSHTSPYEVLTRMPPRPKVSVDN